MLLTSFIKWTLWYLTFGLYFLPHLSFFFGLHCLLSNRMVSELARFGMPKLRLFTGALEAWSYWHGRGSKIFVA